MFLRMEGGGGRGLESSLVEGAEGAGDDGGHGEQPERRKRADHEREQEQDRQPSGAGFGAAPAVHAGLGTGSLQGGQRRRAVADVVGEGANDAVRRLAPSMAELVDGDVGRAPVPDGAPGVVQCVGQARRRPACRHRERRRHRQACAHRQCQHIDQIG